MASIFSELSVLENNALYAKLHDACNEYAYATRMPMSRVIGPTGLEKTVAFGVTPGESRHQMIMAWQECAQLAAELTDARFNYQMTP